MYKILLLVSLFSSLDLFASDALCEKQAEDSKPLRLTNGSVMIANGKELLVCGTIRASIQKPLEKVFIMVQGECSNIQLDNETRFVSCK